MEKFRWAFIGYGGIAHSVAKQLKGTDNEIAAVYGRSFEKAEKFANEYGAKAYRSLEELLSDNSIEGVYIATPNDSHAFYSEQCILHGKPVLCEKPFAVNKEEAEKVLSLANERGVYAAEAMWTWHNKLSHQVKEWITSGEIGDIISVKATYAFPMLRKNDLSSRLVNPSAAGGSLLDIGIYPVRYIYELFGMPESTDCKGMLFNGVDVEEQITMQYSTFSAELFVSFKHLKGEKLVINGTKGSITVPFYHMASKAKLKSSAKKTAKNEDGFQTLYREEFDNTAKDIRANKLQSEYIPHRATLDTMALLDTLRKQMGVVYPMERKQKAESEQLNAKIKAISHLGFNCKDMQRCMDFYCNIMGCERQFALTYQDFAKIVAADSKTKNGETPGYVKKLEKEGTRLWNVYLKWTDTCFIELFDPMAAFRKHIHGLFDLNYNHYCIEVENIRDFRQAIINRGGAEFIESDIALGADQTLQMWMHDPEGNRFELMEYTDKSYQLYGNDIKF